MRPPRDLDESEEKALGVYEGAEDVRTAMWEIMNKWPYLSVDFLVWLCGEDEGMT